MSAIHSAIAALLAEGRSISKVAQLTGVADNTVRYHRGRSRAQAEMGSAGPPRETQSAPGASPLVTQSHSTREQVRALLDAGLSRVEVARRLRLSKSTVSYHARRSGMDMDVPAAHRFDWKAIQSYYHDGHSVAESRAAFGFSASAWTGAVRRGAIVSRPRAVSIEALLSAPRGRAHLKRRLLRAGLLSRACERSGISEWRGQPLSLQLHHVNGDGRDNRLENLQMLCPNCHSQTASWGGRNGGGRRRAPEARAA